MKTDRRSGALQWWHMGRNAKARNMDYVKMAEDIIHPGTKKVFLDGAEGKEKPKSINTASRTVSS